MRSQTTSSGNVARRRHAKTSHTVLRDASVLRLCLTTFCATLLLAACSHAPPEGFAPDPGLVGQIRDIRIVTAYTRACPGSTIPTTYEAVLADGSRVPFSRTYDKKHPPRLHVIFLDRESPDAVSQEDGDWVAERDPLVAVPPADWLVIESRGGRGGTGVTGSKGTDGSSGAAGCPAQPGAPGGNGGSGGPGGSGGHGGRVTVIVPLDNPFLAGIVAGRSPGGPGGTGGPGGAGGKGGKGGQGALDANNRRCPDAADGAPGQAGSAGPTGSQGAPAPRAIVVTAPTKEIIGLQVPPELGSLLERVQRRP